MDKYITDLDQATAVSDSDTLFGNINGQAVQIPVGAVTRASYKLKQRITISENTRLVAIDEDADGSALDLTCCHIGIVIPPDSSITSGPSMLLRVNGVSDEVYTSTSAISNGFKLSTLPPSGYTAGVNLFAQGSASLNSLTGLCAYARFTLTDGVYTVSSDRLAYTTIPSDRFQKITQLELLLSSSSFYFPLGTTIDVWGW